MCSLISIYSGIFQNFVDSTPVYIVPFVFPAILSLSRIHNSYTLLQTRRKMPFCNVGVYQNEDGDAPSSGNGIKIFYRTYGRGPAKILMIIGKAFHPFFFSLICSGVFENRFSMNFDGFFVINTFISRFIVLM